LYRFHLKPVYITFNTPKRNLVSVIKVFDNIRIQFHRLEEAPGLGNSILNIPDKPGLGISLDESFLKNHLPKDEPWWG
jgi:hypothetical protein